jgi:hypothetical protein
MRSVWPTPARHADTANNRYANNGNGTISLADPHAISEAEP